MRQCATLITASIVILASAGYSMAQPADPETVAEHPPLLSGSNSATSIHDDVSTDSVDDNGSEQITMKLVTRGIYQCMDGNRAVFVDEENRTKYRQCTQIRAPYYEQVREDDRAGNAQPPCSGAILYRGSTYVFNDQEPCPIPEEIFEARKPIEANPEYYTQPES